MWAYDLRRTRRNDALREVLPRPLEAIHQNSPESSAVALRTVSKTTPIFFCWPPSSKRLLTLLEFKVESMVEVGDPIVVLVLEAIS